MLYIIAVTGIVSVAILLAYFVRESRVFVLPIAPTLVALLTVWSIFYQVPAGHVGIVYGFGAIVDQTGDGLRTIRPWWTMKPASVQVQGHTFKRLDSFSKETQDVYVAATINVQVSPQYIQALYREVGPNYFDILVRPRVLQAFKDETVKYPSVEIAPHREDIRRLVRDRLTKELQAHSISVQDLLIDNISFSEKFQAAIEEKQTQSQLALAEREKVAAKKAEADQTIETARGNAQAILITAEKQAEANNKVAKSLTPLLIQYEFVSNLSPNVNVMLVPNNLPLILNPDAFKTTPKKTDK